MNASIIYNIHIRGRLETEWSDWFDGLTITPEPGGGTLISGPVRDQAALFSLLLRIHDLGLELISLSPKENTD